MSDEAIPIAWRPRTEPLGPVAILARGPASLALGSRLLRANDPTLARLRGVAGKDLLVLLGEAADLPWVDEVTWLGRDPEAPGLLLPTTLEPLVPLALLSRAVLRGLPIEAPPVAILPAPALLVPTGRARPIERQILAEWLVAQRREALD